MEENDKVIRLPNRRPPSVARFCRKVRLARGNVCENCGAAPEQCQIESHHILDYHVFPQYAKDEENIIVVCQRCHPVSRYNSPDLLGESMLDHARLKPELRERIASYVLRKEPRLSAFAETVRRGEDAATDYFFRRLEMKAPNKALHGTSLRADHEG